MIYQTEKTVHLPAAVHYWGCHRLVACMRHLAKQSRLLPWATTHDRYSRYVSNALVGAVFYGRLICLTSLALSECVARMSLTVF